MFSCNVSLEVRWNDNVLLRLGSFDFWCFGMVARVVEGDSSSLFRLLFRIVSFAVRSPSSTWGFSVAAGYGVMSEYVMVLRPKMVALVVGGRPVSVRKIESCLGSYYEGPLVHLQWACTKTVVVESLLALGLFDYAFALECAVRMI